MRWGAAACGLLLATCLGACLEQPSSLDRHAPLWSRGAWWTYERDDGSGRATFTVIEPMVAQDAGLYALLAATAGDSAARMARPQYAVGVRTSDLGGATISVNGKGACAYDDAACGFTFVAATQPKDLKQPPHIPFPLVDGATPETSQGILMVNDMPGVIEHYTQTVGPPKTLVLPIGRIDVIPVVLLTRFTLPRTGQVLEPTYIEEFDYAPSVKAVARVHAQIIGTPPDSIEVPALADPWGLAYLHDVVLVAASPSPGPAPSQAEVARQMMGLPAQARAAPTSTTRAPAVTTTAPAPPQPVPKLTLPDLGKLYARTTFPTTRTATASVSNGPGGAALGDGERLEWQVLDGSGAAVPFAAEGQRITFSYIHGGVFEARARWLAANGSVLATASTGWWMDEQKSATPTCDPLVAADAPAAGSCPSLRFWVGTGALSIVARVDDSGAARDDGTLTVTDTKGNQVGQAQGAPDHFVASSSQGWDVDGNWTMSWAPTAGVQDAPSYTASVVYGWPRAWPVFPDWRAT